MLLAFRRRPRQNNAASIRHALFARENTAVTANEFRRSPVLLANLKLRGLASMRLVAFLAVLAISHFLPAQTFSVLHGFGSNNDGANPMAGVTMDRAGHIYGTTDGSVGSCCGTVWRASQNHGAWTYDVLYKFRGGTDGKEPDAKVTVGRDGALYGTTLFGGGTGCNHEGCGIVFKLNPPPRFCHNILCTWNETVIHRFDDDPAHGVFPWADVVFDSAGTLYGTALGGGTGNCPNGGCGVVFKMAQSGGNWTYSVIYNFGDGDGAAPTAGLTLDSAENLYGTTQYGGIHGFGNVFQLVRSGEGWTYHSLYSFTGGDDGGLPIADVVLDAAGNIYGDNTLGGAHFGVVWELSPAGGAWNFTAIDSPNCCLTGGVGRDPAGNLYVATWSGGQNDTGALYELSPSGPGWIETKLHDFGNNDGAFPYTDVFVGPDGTLYGTASSGGIYNGGTIWSFTP